MNTMFIYIVYFKKEFRKFEKLREIFLRCVFHQFTIPEYYIETNKIEE